MEAITGYAAVNGISMYYEIHGTGDVPLVLIHGGGSTIETSFGKLLPLLSADFKVIALELQAHGRTSDRDAPESFEQDADDVYALLQYLKIDKANILGFSNGGSTALQLAIRHPEVVNKLVPVAAATKRDGLLPGLFEGLANATLKDMPAFLQEAYLKVAPDKNGLQTMFEKDRQRMLSFKDWNDDLLRSITAPTLLMVADKDVVTAAHTQNMADLIKDSQMVVLPGYHGGFIGEAGSAQANSNWPQITANIIKEFLATES